MLTREFFNPVSGPCIFTVKLPAEREGISHYTYRLTFSPGKDGFKPAIFASMLVGPDNRKDYAYLGLLGTGGNIRTTQASKLTRDSFPVKLLDRVLTRIFANEGDAITSAGFDVMHEGFCGLCGTPLTVPESIESGIGPICRKKYLGG